MQAFEVFLATDPAVMSSALAATVSLLVAVGVVVTQRYHGSWTIDTQIGIQKVHSNPTPRVGGLAIAAGVGSGYLVAPPNIQILLWPVMLASIPAFAFGLLEDLTKRVQVRMRLLATMASGVLGWLLTDLVITDVNIPGLDWLLGFTLVSVLFTAFAVGGVANAINIIDGFNGLSSGTVLMILAGFAALALQQNDDSLVGICLLMGGAVLGFMVVNWPWGKLFLGDGGAYYLGFTLAWMAVMILARHPEVSAWAPLMICGYPVLEVGFSIWRRKKRHLSPGAPDRLHLHSLVKRRVVRARHLGWNHVVRNSLTGTLMWLASLPPVLMAVTWPTRTPELVLGFVCCALMYSVLYRRLTQFCWCIRPATLIAVRPVRQ